MPENKMKQIILVLGGCRSGKSRHALEMAEALPEKKKFFAATCVPQDEEMKLRVQQHREERGAHWQAVEEPVALWEMLADCSRTDSVVLIDCLTLWVSNLMTENEDFTHVQEKTARLVDALKSAPGSVVLVSNEVGAGIVPENRLARAYRDAVGWVNQTVAAAADRVVWTVAGIPVTIKPGR